MDLLTWLRDHPGIVGDVALVLLYVDRWVHRRQQADEDHGAHLSRLDATMDKINLEASGRHSLIMSRIMAIELDVRELKTLIQVRRRPRD